MNHFLYYCLTIPISRLPLGVIYFFSHFFYFFLRFLTPYRKKVIDQNLQQSFPVLNRKEVGLLRKKFYRYLANLFAESVKILTMKKSKLQERLVVRNPEIMNRLYEEGKSVVLLSSHLNNWEFLIPAQSLLFRHQAIGIGMPLTDKFWDEKLTHKRERFGMKVANPNNYKEILKTFTSEPTATLVLNDQSPGKDENCYWTNFLNQETAFYFGAEIMANEMDMAVVYAEIHLVKRGYYELELKLITDKPREEEYGYITQTYVSLLEEGINNQVENWLWSHKRWKKKIPENLQELKIKHKKRFQEKFRKEVKL